MEIVNCPLFDLCVLRTHPVYCQIHLYISVILIVVAQRLWSARGACRSQAFVWVAVASTAYKFILTCTRKISISSLWNGQLTGADNGYVAAYASRELVCEMLLLNIAAAAGAWRRWVPKLNSVFPIFENYCVYIIALNCLHVSCVCTLYTSCVGMHSEYQHPVCVSSAWLTCLCIDYINMTARRLWKRSSNAPNRTLDQVEQMNVDSK